MQNFTDVFISYGRRESKTFATKLYNRLLANGYSVWFDQNDIPLGVDYQNQIDDGIEKAHTFIFIISPHSIASPYCRLEIELAVRRCKKIIPILQVEGFDFEKMHPQIGKINWLPFREILPQGEISWENAVELDDFAKGFLGLVNLLEQHKSYVQQHTLYLHDALLWERHQKSTQYLLIGKQRLEAEKWLLTEFPPPSQAPCAVSDLHAEFICESKKNAANLMTEVFISYDTQDALYRDAIKKSLEKHGITSWVHHKDIQSGVDFGTAINQGIEQADNFIFFISKESVQSEWCLKELQYALQLNKRIIPLYIEEVKNTEIPPQIRGIQYINFVDNRDKHLTRKANSDFQEDIDALLREIREDASYYMQHKVFLCQALKWQKNNKKGAFLLRGYNLQNAQTFLSAGNSRVNHKPTQIHEDFIEESIAKIGQLGSEVFVSYSRNDGDFARKLNNELQLIGKTTWFDQESIATGANFQKEIYRGIENSDNFLFLISPKSIASPFCEDEVNYAVGLNKRFVTLLLEPLDAASMAKFKTLPKLNEVQWINFYETEFTKSFYELLTTLDTDREHVQFHTKYSQRATDWQDRDRTTDLLLQGSQLSQAQEWLQDAIAHQKQPQATSLVQEFIEVSKQVEIQKIALENQRQAKELKLEQEKADAMQQSLIAAERAATEAQKAAEEAQKSLRLQKRASKIQKVLGAIVGVIAVVALYTAYTAFQSQQKAEIEKLRAETNEKQAKEEKEKARQLFVEANKQKREAEHNAAVALEQTVLAENSMLLAQKRERQVMLAQQKTKLALTKADSAILGMEAANVKVTNLLAISEEAKNNAERQAELAKLSKLEMERRENKLEQMLQHNLEETSRKKGIEYAQDLVKLADYYELRGKYAHSDSLYAKTIEVLQKENKQTETYTNMLADIANAYYARMEYAKALTLYEEVATIKKQLGERTESYAEASNNVGLTYAKQQKFKQALVHSLLAMSIRKDLMGEKSRTYGSSLNDVAMIYLEQGSTEKALELLKEALEIEVYNKKENTTMYAMITSNMAKIELQKQKYDEAEKLYLKAFEIRNTKYSPTHPDYLQTIEDLGNLYYKKEDYVKALLYYQKAMDIKKNTHGESHPQYAMALNNVGLVQYSQEKYDQAIKYFREAKTVMELGNHKNIYYASFVSNIADAYQMLNETDSSQKYYDQTIALKRKYVDAGNRDYLLQINEIANMQYTKGNYKEALELYKEAAEKELLARKVTADYRIYLRNMALAYKELQQIDDEIKIMEKAAEAQKELFGENSSEYAYDLNEVAHLYYAHPTSATKAANFYIKSANIEKELNGKSPNYIIYIRNLGYLQYNILKDYIAARKTFEELIQLQQQKEMTTTTTYAADLSYLGMTYYEEKNPKGIAYLEESKKIYKTLEGESLDYTNAVQNIALFYSEQLGDFVKAEVAQIALCALRKKQYAEDSNSKTALQEYTDALRFLSYSQIMNNKMAEAEKNTTEGLKLSMNNIRFEVRLAFIYCFTNRFEKGQAILLKYKEKEYPSNDADKILSKEIYQDFYKDMLKTNLNKQILEKIKQVIE